MSDSDNVPYIQERLRQVAEEVRMAFPRPIEGQELVLIDVDPRHLHAFWSVPPSAVEAARSTLAGMGDTAPLVLRVHEWTDDRPESAFDVEIVGLQGQCYIDVWGEARCYRATLGLRGQDRSLTPLVASLPVELPALAPAESAHPRPAAPKAIETPAPAVPSAPTPTAVKPAAVPGEPVRHPFPLPPMEAGDYVPDLLTTRGPATGPGAAELTGTPPSASAADAPSGAPDSTQATPSAASAPQPPPTAADALPEPVHYDFPLPPMEAGEYGPELLGGFLPPDAAPPEPAIGAPAEPVQDTAAGESPVQPGEPPPPPDDAEPLPLPLENVLSLSSFALGREQVEFEINAELHIFGRAKAGTQLHLFGRKVTLRPDGTFSITRPLPNGALVLSSLLVNGSNDGHSD